MRRADREVTDPEKILEMVRRCTCCRIGFCDDGKVYIVPLSFGFAKTGNTYVFYFHSAREGRKLDLIRKNPDVGFEMDSDYEIIAGDVACDYSARFRSIIGNGTLSMVESMEEKRLGLTLIMEQQAGRQDWVFHDKMVDAVAVFKLTVTEMSCKERM